MIHEPSPEAPLHAGSDEYSAQLPAIHRERPASRTEHKMMPPLLSPDYRGSGRLEGQIALIIGADAGIGRAVAALLGREGADVAVAYLGEDGDAEDIRRCIEAEGRRCLVLRGDVRDAAWCRQAVQRTVDEFGRVDVLVNNSAWHRQAAPTQPLDGR